jgi:hypothetical protein
LGRSGAKTILFKVSGVIELTSRLNIKDNVTIAGQTAPGDGICLKNYEANVGGNNVIIRFIRFRPGPGGEPDCIWGRYLNNVILDHCTMGWAVDECASFYSNLNFTMQWCILHEALNNSTHPKGAHGYGGLWGGKNASFHHNLLIHNSSRNPRFNGWKRSGLDYNNPQDEERMDFRNNVLFNWGGNTGYGGEAAGKYNVVNNYYKPGPASSATHMVQIDKDGTTNAAITPKHGTFYIDGNYYYGSPSKTADNTTAIKNNSGQALSACLVSTPYDCTPVTTHTAEEAYEKVLAVVGASLARDTIERRLVREVRSGTPTFTGSKTKKKGLIDSPADAEGYGVLNYQTGNVPADTDIDGIPDGWLEQHYPGSKATDLNAEGYTYLEVYLNSLVEHITSQQGNFTGIESPTAGDRPTVYYDAAAGEVRVQSAVPVQSTRLYSLQGSALPRVNGRGVYLVQVSLKNGQVFTGKIIVE